MTLGHSGTNYSLAILQPLFQFKPIPRLIIWMRIMQPGVRTQPNRKEGILEIKTKAKSRNHIKICRNASVTQHPPLVVDE